MHFCCLLFASDWSSQRELACDRLRLQATASFRIKKTNRRMEIGNEFWQKKSIPSILSKVFLDPSKKGIRSDPDPFLIVTVGDTLF